ncbi:hypothetical protein J8281_13050 [Aquimarina sp. U1-2]|uniref:hypothetical protein n=1 Tax=Aquimarina sp. U1-2 TaxID=2823141 RepID=UPI001AEC769F|nr:hypothetical protein [Aquimarina sp. U1-2]MBP2833115.1 hypothetical protein [Aquimarina sp. U1-2]
MKIPMDVFTHTLNWIKGEIFESYIFGSFGLVLVSVAFSFKYFGTTPNAKNLFIPLVLVSVIFICLSSYQIYSNTKRKKVFELEYKTDKNSFLEKEKQRVSGFSDIFKFTIAIGTISIGLGVLLFVLYQKSNVQAWSIALILFGLTGLTIDFFAKERADEYEKQLITDHSITNSSDKQFKFENE